MEEVQLKESFVKLREEIARLDPQDAASRARLDKLISDIEQRLANPENGPHAANLIENVQEAIEHFEVEHPRTTSLLNQIMVTLANMGI